MKFIKYLSIANFLILVLFVGYFFYQKRETRTAFVYNQKVFDQFKGKIDLQAKLENHVRLQKAELDSLEQLIKNGHSELESLFQQKSNEAAFKQQQMSEQYTSDLWKHINSEIINFGKENNYDFIYGASGNGSLMFAGERHDVTDLVVQYLNSKY